VAIRWGLIGCGDVALHKGGPALAEARGGALGAVMSRDPAKGGEYAGHFGCSRVYGQIGELLADGDLDAVYIATPPNLHAEQTLRSAQAAKHILCEKPMALSTQDCRRMIHGCDRSGVKLFVAYYRRRFPAIVKMKALLDEGIVGRITMARAQCSFPYQPLPDAKDYWRLDPAIAGGGFLWDIGSHRIDLLVHLLGQPRRVTAFVETVTIDAPVDDSASLLIAFEGGAQAAGLFHWNVAANTDEIEIGGTGGRIRCDMATGEVVCQRAKGSAERWKLPPPRISHLGLVEDVVKCVAEDAPNPCDGHEGLQTNAIMEAAEMASREGQAIDLEEVPGWTAVS